jgi:hypothetical protein
LKLRFILFLVLCGCAPGSFSPPWSASFGFFGAVVTVGQPGYIVPAKVVTTSTVSTPTLLVPADAPVGDTVPVTTSTGKTTIVPVKASAVSVPILAIPDVKLNSTP